MTIKEEKDYIQYLLRHISRWISSHPNDSELTNIKNRLIYIYTEGDMVGSELDEIAALLDDRIDKLKNGFIC